jgi:hypothetical protein
MALEADHHPPGAAVVEPVGADVQQPLDAPHRRSVLSQAQDAVVRVVVATVRAKQRTPCVRADLGIGQEVMVALEVLDGAPGAGAEDAVGRYAEQMLQLGHQRPGASRSEDGARDGVTVGGVRRLRHNQRCDR